MKYVLCLAGLAGLLTVIGCESEHHDHGGQGGYGNDTYYGSGYGPSGDRFRGYDKAPPQYREGQWDRDYRNYPQ
ncbi:hypothetical protein [Pedosphaera parvula]|uniref:Lipoprotein n=1 Tax=Pedosphaera parvula (strain Ellin514) TaxID=320771 RepID=B9XKN5_PEDPL|nr:hypothetical protein [Pedosphaera parvula]EEF59528.1 hypothetical protein Cflav_PD2435 [Pedosphaera parvula Ellin514]